MTDSPSHPPVPVVCDRCRAEGKAGDAAFGAIPDILAFDPVPRRAHVNNWTAEHQRAFITALALTGSPRQAARVLGRHMFGAQQLRTARGGRSFSDAWDAALEIARDREFSRIHANLGDLAAQSASEAEGGPTGMFATPANLNGDTIADDSDVERREYLEANLRIRDRLTRARRLLLFHLVEDEAKRAAWECLVGPVDWDRASRLESQADEPFTNPDHEHYEGYDHNPHMFKNPGMLLTAEAGLLAEFTGGPDSLAELAEQVKAIQAGRTEANDNE